MGAYIFSFGIDSDKIKKVFGSADHSLLDQVKKNRSYQHYAISDSDVAKAVEQIFSGERLNLNAHVYGYALICIVSALGSSPPWTQEMKMGYETDLVREHLENDFGISEVELETTMFADNSHNFPIPPNNDFPVIGLMKREEMIKLLKHLESAQISNDAIEDLQDSDYEEKLCAYEHIKGLKENLNFCLQNNLELISFCH